MGNLRDRSILFLTLLLAAACAGPGNTVQSPDRSSQAPSSSSSSNKTIVVAFRYEKNDLSTKTLTQAGQEYRMLFNAGLALVDGQGTVQPYLAENVPQLNTDTWKLLPDGRMETSYRIRPNLTWHDGAPLTANDFVFAWRVYSAPGIGIFSPQPQDHMEEVAAPDAQTLTIRWANPFPDAALLTNEDFPPLPRHLLESAFTTFQQDSATRDLFVNHRYWNPDYVGAGPFRLEHLEPGSHLEASAFAGHALGRPKVDRVIARIIPDENTVLSGVLANAIHVATSITLRFEHAMTLRRTWTGTSQGAVAWNPARLVGSIFQFRPEFLRTPALLDARVRRALVYGIDRQALNEGIFDGQSVIPETYLNPQAPYYPQVYAAISKYSYDPRMAEQLLNEAGIAKDGNGVFAGSAVERFNPDYQVLTGTTFERGGAIIEDSWRRMGIEVQYSVLPAVQVRNNEVRNSFPGISTPGGGILSERALVEFFTGQQIGTPSNGWTGSNRGAWPSAEYDRLFSAFNVTLDRSERNAQIAQMMKLLSDEVPGFPQYLDIDVMGYVGSVKGPSLGITGTSTPLWNTYQWELQV